MNVQVAEVYMSTFLNPKTWLWDTFFPLKKELCICLHKNNSLTDLFSKLLEGMVGIDKICRSVSSLCCLPPPASPAAPAPSAENMYNLLNMEDDKKIGI